MLGIEGAQTLTAWATKASRLYTSDLHSDLRTRASLLSAAPRLGIMPESLRDHLLALSLLPFLTPARARLLRERFDPLTETRRAASATISGLLKIPREQAELVKNPLNDEAIRRIAGFRDAAVTLADDDYPPMLRQIADPPLALHCRGNRELLRRPSIAVVGSRRASPYAENAAAHVATPLAAAGIVIVSGLALGIDAAAHQAALEAGGTTIAVLGCGIDVVYPPSHQRLFRRIAKEGLLVSELPPGTPPFAMNFPIRNRIISGLTAGTVIVEATSRSGSLITARTALEQGREVFAVPGSVFSAGSEGTHRLIQCGAKLVHEPQDILDELRLGITLGDETPAEPVETPLREVLAIVTREEGVHVDAAAAKLGRSAASISEALLQLELGGWVRALPGARYVRVR